MSALERTPLPVSVAALLAGALLMGVAIHGAVEAPPVAAAPPPARPPAEVTVAPEVEATGTLDGEAIHAEGQVRAEAAPAGGCPAALRYGFRAGSEHPRALPDGAPLDELRAILAAHPEARLLVVGHSDGSGDEDANLRLSHRRARRVAARLSAEGVDAARITVRALGEFAPLEGVEDIAAANRRVDVTVRGLEGCAGRSPL